MPAKNQKYTFPKQFLWGASVSAHQVEGGNHNQWSVWELQNAKALAKKAEYDLEWLPEWDNIKKEATKPSNYVSGKAADHYHRYEEDFDLLQEMNMSAFRFSIEWSRIEPEQGKWNYDEIEHYRRYLVSLRKRRIQPIVTMFHWTVPMWFIEKGGFEKKRNIDDFVVFVEKVIDELGDLFKLVCTLNEPDSYTMNGWLTGAWPPAKQWDFLHAIGVYNNLATAHNRVYKMIKRKATHHKVGLSKSFSYYATRDRELSSRLAARVSYYAADEYFLNRTRRNVDWIGVQYYFSLEYKNGVLQTPDKPMSDLGWEMIPDDLENVLLRVHKLYNVPIIVTESGVADHKDRYRRWWIAHEINAIHNAMKAGVNIHGYIHWSLLDNFEWAYGKWPRFGLVEVDYSTMQRTVRASGVWFGRVIKRLREG